MGRLTPADVAHRLARRLLPGHWIVSVVMGRIVVTVPRLEPIGAAGFSPYALEAALRVTGHWIGPEEPKRGKPA